MKRHRPFVVFRDQKKDLLPRESVSFDPWVEKQASFIQVSNCFLVFLLGQQSLKETCYHFLFASRCHDYSQLLLLMITHNLLWIALSLFGLKTVKTRNALRIKQYVVGLVGIVLSRGMVYTWMWWRMGEVKRGNYYCDAVYQGGLYLIQAVIEAGLVAMVLLCSRAVYGYVRHYEQNTEVMDYRHHDFGDDSSATVTI